MRNDEHASYSQAQASNYSRTTHTETQWAQSRQLMPTSESETNLRVFSIGQPCVVQHVIGREKLIREHLFADRFVRSLVQISHVVQDGGTKFRYGYKKRFTT